MTNYFIGIYDEPFHLSVGAVLVNEKGEVACHYFDKVTLLGKTYEDVYLLMRETIEPNETLEQAVARGLMEEFGAEAYIKTYLGSRVTTVKTHKEFQKTTLYFLCALESINPELRSDEDLEKESEVQWHKPEFLIPKMQGQAKRYNMPDLDESEILQRLVAMNNP